MRLERAYQHVFVHHLLGGVLAWDAVVVRVTFCTQFDYEGGLCETERTNDDSPEMILDWAGR